MSAAVRQQMMKMSCLNRLNAVDVDVDIDDEINYR